MDDKDPPVEELDPVSRPGFFWDLQSPPVFLEIMGWFLGDKNIPPFWFQITLPPI